MPRPNSRRPGPAWALLCAAAVLSLAWPTAQARAAGDANAAKGLIAEHCAGCHRVPGYASEGLPTVEAPDFAAIADDPETYNDARLREFLQQPHWPMTQFRLSPGDIDNILAYIAALRGE